MMSTHYDDNFGAWDIEDEDDLAFYHQVQSESTYKRCQGCGAIKKLRPDYGYCNKCTTMLECGGDLDPPDEAFLDPEVDLELQLIITRDKVEREIQKRSRTSQDTQQENGIHEQFEGET